MLYSPKSATSLPFKAHKLKPLLGKAFKGMYNFCAICLANFTS